MVTLGPLVERLRSEDDGSYAYRGQVREYSIPLVPCAYRPFINPAKHLEPTVSTLRSVPHARFVEYDLPVTGIPDVESRLEFQKRLLGDAIRNALGFALKEVFCQQAGLNSEGLDVTTNLDVALFFATHAYSERRYAPFSTSGEGVLYRWRVETPAVSLDALNTWDFFQCPTYLPSRDILCLFDTCETVEEAVASIDEFRSAIGWGLFFDLDQVRGSRPFHLLRIPRRYLAASRIDKQSAGLLIPDALHNRFLEQFAQYRPAGCGGVWDGPCSVEDLGQSRGVEVFRFRHVQGEVQYCRKRQEEIVSDADVELEFVKGWYRTLFWNPYGTVGIKSDIHGEILGAMGPGPLDPTAALLEDRVVDEAVVAVHDVGSTVEELRASHRLANDLVRQKRYPEALAVLVTIADRAGRFNDTSYRWVAAMATNLRGLLLEGLKRHDEAIAAMELNVTLCSRGGDEFRELLLWSETHIARLLGKCGRVEESLAAFDRAIASGASWQEPPLAKRLAEAMYSKGVALDEALRESEAIRVYEALEARFGALEHAQTSVCMAMFNRANDWHRAGDPSQSQALYAALVQRYADTKDEHLTRIVLLARERLG